MLVTSAKRTTVGLVDVASWVVGDASGVASGRISPPMTADPRAH